MVRYFLDIKTDSVAHADEEGSDFPSFKAAKSAAFQLLNNISHDLVRSGKMISTIVDVRDETGQVILSTRLTLDVVTP